MSEIFSKPGSQDFIVEVPVKVALSEFVDGRSIDYKNDLRNDRTVVKTEIIFPADLGFEDLTQTSTTLNQTPEQSERLFAQKREVIQTDTFTQLATSNSYSAHDKLARTRNDLEKKTRGVDRTNKLIIAAMTALGGVAIAESVNLYIQGERTVGLALGVGGIFAEIAAVFNITESKPVIRDVNSQVDDVVAAAQEAQRAQIIEKIAIAHKNAQAVKEFQVTQAAANAESSVEEVVSSMPAEAGGVAWERLPAQQAPFDRVEY